MNLAKKKLLASRALNVGVHRLVFNNSRLSEINEAITKQDIRDLLVSGAIHIKVITGVKKKVKRKTRRRQGDS
jgi:ribosomal protein L19E